MQQQEKGVQRYTLKNNAACIVDEPVGFGQSTWQSGMQGRVPAGGGGYWATVQGGTGLEVGWLKNDVWVAEE